MQGAQVDVPVPHTVHEAHRGQPALERQRAHVLGKGRAADRINGKVGAVPIGRVDDRLREVGLAGAHCDVQSNRFQLGQLLG